MTTLTAADAYRLRPFLDALLRMDAQAPLLLADRAATLTALTCPPSDVVVAIPLSAPAAPWVSALGERAVSAAALRTALGSARDPLPDGLVCDPADLTPVAAPALTVQPPVGPWLPGERGLAGDVRRLVTPDRTAAPRGSAPATGAADGVWGGLPRAAILTALALGLLSHPASRVTSGTCERWKRLATPEGAVHIRPTGMLRWTPAVLPGGAV